jgi:endonuclease YncB( thermonuclease family)
MGRGVVAAVVVLAGLALAVASAAPGRPAAERGVIARVVDGDTVALADGRRVRLLQIDTPEVGTGECYSRKARTVLVQLLPLGSRVELEADPGLDRVDRYGRLLRYLWHAGRNVNVQMVTAGAAAPYFYGGERGKYADTLERMARQARASGLGLWGACRATPYNPYRAISTGQGGTSTSAKQPAAASHSCDPNYAGGCVPPYPPDLDCADIRAMGIAPVRVIGTDPHHLDGDGDGLGCE